RALVGAAVDHGVDRAGLVARHDDRRVADEGGLVVARVGQFGLETEEIPGRSPEDALLLQRVDFGIRIDPERHPRGIVEGPRKTGRLVRLSRIHCLPLPGAAPLTLRRRRYPRKPSASRPAWERA